MPLTPLVAIAITLLLSFLLSELAKHFHYPRVLGQILAGTILGLPLLNGVMSQEALSNIEFLSQLGVIFLFVVIGIESDLSRLKAQRRRSMTIALFTIALPLIAGYVVGNALGYEPLTALVLGVCLALSSGTTNAQVFLDMKILQKPLAKMILSAAILVDLFGILFLAFLLPYLQGDVQEAAKIPVKIIVFTLFMWGLVKVMPLFITHIERDESRVAEVSLLTVFGLLLAVFSTQLGLGEMIGAFFAGLILQLATNHQCSEACGDQVRLHHRHKKFFGKNVRILKVITLSFIIPFLFIHMGLQLDLSQVATKPGVIVSIIAVGLLAKGVAALLSKPWIALNKAQAAVVGWSMNARGTLELVMAELTLTYGVITQEIYTALVLLVVVSTLMLPFALRKILRKHPRAMALAP